MQLRVIVSAVIEKDDKVLMGLKENLAPYPNTWHIPGGGLDIAETLDDGVRREVREETGVEIRGLRRLPFFEDFTKGQDGEIVHYIFLVYLANYESGELLSKSDLQELKWIDKSHIKQMAMDGELPDASVHLFSSVLRWIDSN
jgi:8-oxo-dGTP diphosphatase